MKLAAIDIGSNAVRLQITKVIEYDEAVTFKKLEYVRFPLRLGHDVFTSGEVSEYNKERFHKLMTAYKSLIDLYEVDSYYGCATSAMREAANGNELVERAKEDLDLDLKIITGQEEAEMINKVIRISLEDGNYIHIDVGGGSTELNIYENQVKIASESFKLGSVRRLEHSDDPKVWKRMHDWLNETVGNKYEKIMAIGTGGNINKLFELATNENEGRKMTLEELIEIQATLKGLSLDERLNKLQLNPDRADVIVPASDIYIDVMKSAGANKILVPDAGLKDGINYYMYQVNRPESDKVFVKN